MIIFEKDGSVTLRGDVDPSRTSVIPKTKTQAEKAAAITEFVALEPKVVPVKVTNYQARQALIDVGRFTEIDIKVRSSGNPSIIAAWDYANEFYRSSPFIAMMAAALNMTSEEVDTLLIAADKVV